MRQNRLPFLLECADSLAGKGSTDLETLDEGRDGDGLEGGDFLVDPVSPSHIDFSGEFSHNACSSLIAECIDRGLP